MAVMKQIRYFWLPPLSALLFWIASPGDVGFWPLSGIAFVPLFFFVEKAASKKAPLAHYFLGGVLHGLPLAVGLLYWLVNVLVFYGGLHFSVAVMALVLLGCYLACYFVIFLVAVRSFLTVFSPFFLLFLFPTLWTGLEWVRGWAFTGFPWMDLGCYLAFQPLLIQGAEFFGQYGLTWLLVFCNTALWLFLSIRGQRRFAILFCFAGILAVYFLFSVFSLNQQRDYKEQDFRLGIVQGNIAQELKWSAGKQQKTVSKYLVLSEKLATASFRPDLLVWPETAMPFYLQKSSLTAQLISFVNLYHLPLISGAPWYEIIDRNRKEVAYYNAVFLLNPSQKEQLGGLVFKSHLVPFGEYIPFQDFFPFLAPLVESAGNFSAGTITRPLPVGTASGLTAQVGVLICFESVFSELSRKWVNAGANLLVNVTNDAWYGKTSAPWQTLAMVVLRAVETRRTVVRAANTGFSAFILPTGEVRKRTEWFTPAAVAMSIPLREEKTFFVLYGWIFAPSCLVVAFLFFFWSAGKKRNLFRP